MACERGLQLQQEFEKTIAERIAIERRIGPRLTHELRQAKAHEEQALTARAMHVSACGHCWLDPPPFTGKYYTNL